MRPTRRPIRRFIRPLTLTLAAGLAVLMTAGMGMPTRSAAADPLLVQLGTHTFGHLRAPEAIVAKASPEQVGFYSPPPGGEGVTYGPWSFDIAYDGSIWLLDEVNNRLLVWRAGQPDRPARSVRLPDLRAIADFAVAQDGTIYVTYIGERVPGIDFAMSLAALTPAGKLRWKGPTIIPIYNGVLRLGPDGILYTPGLGEGDWTPLTTRDGRLLTIAEQRRQTRPGQPLPGGLRLTAAVVSDHEQRYRLTDRSGRVLRAWRVTSETEIGGLLGTPALVGGDPVVMVHVSKQTEAKFLWEFLVLRLAPGGGTRQRFAVDARAMWGSERVTDLRVGPDGRLYQLRTSPTSGASIARYSLGPVAATPPSTTHAGGGAVTPSTVAPPPATTVPAPSVTVPPAAPAMPPVVQAEPARRSIVPWLGALGAGVLFALGVWLLYRQRHPRTRSLGGHRPPRPAH